jgi:hypothetical protein
MLNDKIRKKNPITQKDSKPDIRIKGMNIRIKYKIN